MPLKPLCKGDHLALIAPSSPFSKKDLQRACDFLRRKGFYPLLGKAVFERNGYLAGNEDARARDLIDAICNPQVAGVLCIRGGYGSARMLPWLPYSRMKKNNKIFAGYSDVTSLHLSFLSRMGWTTFHGPNLINMDSFPEHLERTLEALSGEKVFSWSLSDVQVLKEGIAKGILFGGNLTCLVHLLGTPYFPDPTGAMLLLEDCGEALYRIDRMFNQLKLSGVLSKISGLILGHFKDCGGPAEISKMVLEHLKSYAFPVVGFLPFGHGKENDLIPFGTPFYLNTYERLFRAVEHPFGS